MGKYKHGRQARNRQGYSQTEQYHYERVNYNEEEKYIDRQHAKKAEPTKIPDMALTTQQSRHQAQETVTITQTKGATGEQSTRPSDSYNQKTPIGPNSTGGSNPTFSTKKVSSLHSCIDEDGWGKKKLYNSKRGQA